MEEGWKCPAAGGACTPPPPVVRGDKKLGAGEACDDGNTADGDGCAANCKTIENGGQGWDCRASASPARPSAATATSAARSSATTATTTAATAAHRPARSKRVTSASGQPRSCRGLHRRFGLRKRRQGRHRGRATTATATGTTPAPPITPTAPAPRIARSPLSLPGWLGLLLGLRRRHRSADRPRRHLRRRQQEQRRRLL